MKNDLSLQIQFGALSYPLKKQVLDQGYKCREDKMKAFQSNSDAITRLRFASLLNDTEYNKIREKLFKQILAHVKKENPLTQPTK